MRFTSIALPLFTFVAAAVQLHASPSPIAVNVTDVSLRSTEIQRRDTSTANIFFLPGNLDTVTYSDIDCSIGAGAVCNQYVGQAIEAAVSNYLFMISNWLYEGYYTPGSGFQYGFDDESNVAASVFYYFPSSISSDGNDVDFNVLQDFFDNAINDQTNQPQAALISSIVNQLSNYDEIEACLEFEINGGSFVGGTTLILIGWADEAYYVDSDTAMDWLNNCLDVVSDDD